MSPATAAACPCGWLDPRGRGLSFDNCCGRYLDHDTAAPDAESLMRSRYTAYALGRREYLLSTWHPSTRPADLQLDPAAQWLGLTVRRHAPAGDHAEVEFVARSRSAGAGGGQAQRLQERSRFVREGGRWYYLEGVVKA